jgi:hypothetical protein
MKVDTLQDWVRLHALVTLNPGTAKQPRYMTDRSLDDAPGSLVPKVDEDETRGRLRVTKLFLRRGVQKAFAVVCGRT